MERNHTFFVKIYDILVFLNFLYLLQTLQNILTYLDSIENILILFCHYFHNHLEKVNLYTLINFYLLTLFRMREGRGGGVSPVKSTNVVISIQNFLTFSFSPFGTLG